MATRRTLAWQTRLTAVLVPVGVACSGEAQADPPTPDPPAAEPAAWIEHHANPVFDVGPPGAWDAGTVFDATVIQFRDTLRMWYTGNDVTHLEALDFSIGYAWSLDGIQWHRRTSPVVSTPGNTGVAAPTVLAVGDTLHMWYATTLSTQPGRAIGHATSVDGIDWTLGDDPAVQSGPTGAWDESFLLGPTAVMREWGYFRMWYSGGTGTFPNPAVIQTGLATSLDGLVWTKHDGPVLEVGTAGSFDEIRAWAGSIRSTNPGYEMWYTGESAEPRQSIGYATSNDGIEWVKRSGPLLTASGGWAFEFAAPEVLPIDDHLAMWFTGLERFPSAIGRIGLATLDR